VIGAGVSPATGFIDGRAVKKHQDQSIIADQYLATGAPGLYVAGDLVRYPTLPFTCFLQSKIGFWLGSW
jgi:thioredoxin reductase